MTFPELVKERHIIVCLGAGGVGKTTSSASLALAGVAAGRRTLVITIDPAKRLANAIGLPTLGHDVAQVERARLVPIFGEGAGELHAMMLDQKRSFDELVERFAADPAARARIYANPIYQQISSRLAGSHEYAAIAKVHELAASKKYDLIVLDTPPTANALDFLDAPERLAEAIDSPTIEWLAKPAAKAGTFSLKALSIGASFVLKRMAKFTGQKFLEDISTFFVEFNQILGGFRQQAKEVADVLRRPDVAYVVVSSPEPMAIDEALFFATKLKQSRMHASAFIVNRVHTAEPYEVHREKLVNELAAKPELAFLDEAARLQFAAELETSYRDYATLSRNDAAQIARLAAVESQALIAKVPFFDRDVYDVDSLRAVMNAILGHS